MADREIKIEIGSSQLSVEPIATELKTFIASWMQSSNPIKISLLPMSILFYFSPMSSIAPSANIATQKLGQNPSFVIIFYCTETPKSTSRDTIGKNVKLSAYSKTKCQRIGPWISSRCPKEYQRKRTLLLLHQPKNQRKSCCENGKIYSVSLF